MSSGASPEMRAEPGAEPCAETRPETRPEPRGQRIGVLSFAHYHANFWSEVFAGQHVLEAIWDDDRARGAEAAARRAKA